jgi:hypothetical protein
MHSTCRGSCPVVPCALASSWLTDSMRTQYSASACDCTGFAHAMKRSSCTALPCVVVCRRALAVDPSCWITFTADNLRALAPRCFCHSFVTEGARPLLRSADSGTDAAMPMASTDAEPGIASSGTSWGGCETAAGLVSPARARASEDADTASSSAVTLALSGGALDRLIEVAGDGSASLAAAPPLLSSYESHFTSDPLIERRPLKLPPENRRGRGGGGGASPVPTPAASSSSMHQATPGPWKANSGFE